MERYGIMCEAVKTFGKDEQQLKAIEECAELTDALLKWRAGRISETEVITEIADVQIMVQQLSIIFGRDKVNKEIERKLQRLQERIKKEQE